MRDSSKNPHLMGNIYIIFITIQYLALSLRKIQISLFVSGLRFPTLTPIIFIWLSVGLTVVTKVINRFHSLLLKDIFPFASYLAAPSHTYSYVGGANF
jgi:hypothetical protein